MNETGEACLSYNDAVEDALCFGWIDSTIKHIDTLHRAQRFTPRKPGSAYSRPNIERLIRLDKQGLIHPKVRESVAEMIRAPYVFPPDIMEKSVDLPAPFTPITPILSPLFTEKDMFSRTTSFPYDFAMPLHTIILIIYPFAGIISYTV